MILHSVTYLVLNSAGNWDSLILLVSQGLSLSQFLNEVKPLQLIHSFTYYSPVNKGWTTYTSPDPIWPEQ